MRHGGEKVATAMIELLQNGEADQCLGAAVYQRIDDDKVVTYAQWEERAAAQDWLDTNRNAKPSIADDDRWVAKLIRLASSANRGNLDLAGAHATIAHTGLFALHSPGAMAPFLMKAQEAARIA
jgi:hypothetical protein